jgi:hypothetical protein
MSMSNIGAQIESENMLRTTRIDDNGIMCKIIASCVTSSSSSSTTPRCIIYEGCLWIITPQERERVKKKSANAKKFVDAAAEREAQSH